MRQDHAAIYHEVSTRMLLAGIHAELGMNPRLKHSGVTVWESVLFYPASLSNEDPPHLPSTERPGGKRGEASFVRTTGLVNDFAIDDRRITIIRYSNRTANTNP